ncbi:MAG: arginine--tRNA ligase [candidate division WOR-3 bacterium]|nr:arginine--tRNA ligase [candidate division WOR-3 bacterium]
MFSIKTSFGEIEFLKPNNFKYADATSNIAFKLSKEIRKNPIVIANEIVNEIKNNDAFEKVENINGFINVFFSKKFFIDFVMRIIEEDFISKIEKKQRFLIEFVSANPTGPLNIVNARAGAIGDSLVRIGRFLGNEVISEYYVNDEGSQIENLGYSILWRLGIKFVLKNGIISILNNVEMEKIEILEIDGKILDMSESVYKGSYLIEVSQLIKEEVMDKISQYSGKEGDLDKIRKIAYEIGKICAKYILSWQLETLRIYRVEYDNVVKESFIRNSKYPKIVLEKLKDYLYLEDMEKNKYKLEEKELEKLLNREYYVKNYGGKALVLKTTIYGDDKDRVLIRSNGEPTYFFWDIAYHYYKIERIGNGYIINLLGPDHYGYVPRLKSALKMLNFENIQVLIIQQTNLIQEGKKLDMSKRKGQIYEMNELIEEVGIDASRFFFLLRSPSAHLDFDINLAKKLSSENPVFYVQYAHARIESIKEHAKTVGISIDFNRKYLENYNFENERHLLVLSTYFEDNLKKAFYGLEPHLLVYYLLEVVEAFHKYYQKHRVIDIEDKNSTISRIIILEAIRKIINKGLELLGVDAPTKM